MKKREIVLLVIALVYCIAGLFGSTAVSNTVIRFIEQNGWDELRYWTYRIGGGLAGLTLVLVFIRLWFRLPTPREFTIGVVGTAFTAFVITNFVLLTTEIIHIPQFMILTMLFLFAFPRHPQTGLLLSQIACIGDEWAQSMLPGRILDLNDVFLNFIGMFAGMLCWWALSIFPLPKKKPAKS
ncbi:MAG: VanZ family protein [bacterium]|nr:VanZ family protein [bacterium]